MAQCHAPEGDYDLAVFVGRFQPPHKGHLHVMRQGLAQARRLLVVIGSAGAARRPDLCPFTAEEREAMILASLDEAERERVAIRFVPDFSNLTLWAEAVQAQAAELLAGEGRVALIGCSKDRSSYYLNAFPQWAAIAVEPQLDGLSATPFRLAYFDEATADTAMADLAPAQLPAPVIDWLQAFRTTAAYRELVEEMAFAKRYRAAWATAPYPPIFVTSDAVVIQGAHVLMIRRKSRPGRGLWALPGGFVEQDEFVLDAALRELTEETGLQVAQADLRRGHLATRVFDAPFRDMRGRVITHASLFHLPATGQGLPKAVAADDAADVRWTPLGELRREALYGDHFQIIHALAALIGDAG